MEAVEHDHRDRRQQDRICLAECVVPMPRASSPAVRSKYPQNTGFVSAANQTKQTTIRNLRQFSSVGSELAIF